MIDIWSLLPHSLSRFDLHLLTVAIVVNTSVKYLLTLLLLSHLHLLHLWVRHIVKQTSLLRLQEVLVKQQPFCLYMFLLHLRRMFFRKRIGQMLHNQMNIRHHLVHRPTKYIEIHMLMLLGLVILYLLYLHLIVLSIMRNTSRLKIAPLFL